MEQPRPGRTGFTLIELLVVIAIIAILAAILFPVFVQAQKSAKTSKCQSNLKQIALAFQRYVDDNNGGTPPYVAGSFSGGSPGGMTILPWPGSGWKTGILVKYLKSEFIAACSEHSSEAMASQAIGGASLLNYNRGIGVYGYNAAYLAWAGVNYGYSMDTTANQSHVKMSMVQKPAKTICFIDALDGWATPPQSQIGPKGFDCVAAGARHNSGWNVAFCDGHGRYFQSSAGDRDRRSFKNRSVIGANDELWDLK